MKAIQVAANGYLPLAELNPGLDDGKSRRHALSKATSRIVWTMTPNGAATDSEDEWKAFTGKTGADVRTEALHPDDRASAAAKWAEAMRTGAAYEMEQRVCRRDGEYCWMLVRVRPVLNNDGSILEWIGNCTDISECKLAAPDPASEASIVAPDTQGTINVFQTGAEEGLALMNRKMQQMDSYHATLIGDRATGALNPRIPIVAATAGVIAGDREKCIEARADRQLSKPVEPDSAECVFDESLCRPPQTETLHAPPPSQALEFGPAVFDHQDLVRRLGENQALARKVVHAFLEAAPSQLSNLRRQLTGRDVQAVRREAHTLKGAAATISAPVLRGLALKAEQAIEAGEWTTVEELLPRMDDQLERLRTAVADWR